MPRIILFLTLLCFTAACSGEKYGTGVDKAAPIVTVKDVYLDRSLQDNPVTLEGIIIGQCGSPDKCWFFMHDETGRIFVNLKPANLSLPPAMGKKVRVTGMIQGDKQGYQIVAQGVEVL
ncbi:MAG TPA: hypothetical protein VK852_02955 [Desulfobacterales bacterium]|jgi:uncharacterized protein YdeI (BOF family)|nr:hypothetical protein [Desulfobacterales bacterium]